MGTGQKLVGRPPIAIFQLILGGGGRCVVWQGLCQGWGRHRHQLCSWGLVRMGGPWPLEGAQGEGPALLVAGQSGSWGATACSCGRRGRWRCTGAGTLGRGEGQPRPASWGAGWGQGEGPTPAAPSSAAHPARPAGIFFSSGARWKAARQFTDRTLHSLGMGRGPVADMVLQELSCLKGQLDSYGGESEAGAPLSLRLYAPGRPFPWLCLAGPAEVSGVGTPLPGAPPSEPVPLRPPLPAGSAPLGFLQRHLHTALRPAV